MVFLLYCGHLNPYNFFLCGGTAWAALERPSWECFGGVNWRDRGDNVRDWWFIIYKYFCSFLKAYKKKVYYGHPNSYKNLLFFQHSHDSPLVRSMADAPHSPNDRVSWCAYRWYKTPQYRQLDWADRQLDDKKYLYVEISQKCIRIYDN